ncbi:YgaP family membrane protein [Nocardia tengchongensis]|uniref:YgaP family membrane protein n=1 Tax=Nocardia tengchongensis TaxID=2055889 RepID=UPI00368FF9CD
MTANRRWPIDRLVPVLAATMVLLSIALVLAFSTWWLLLTAFVAANLMLYGIVGWCPMTLLLQRLGVPRTGYPATERIDR